MKRLRAMRLGVAVGLLCWPAAAEPGRAADDLPQEPTSVREAIDAEVQRTQVFENSTSETAAKPLVVLRWANNARGSEDGLTLLYVQAGRPLAAACLYPWEGRLVRDFEALRSDIVARRDGAIIWRPAKAGVEFTDLPDTEAPAETRSQRLRQLKALAAEFQSTMLGWKSDDSDREELRVLPRPLYRYEPTDDGPIVDGAVFGFVMGTDPESLLLLEAIKDAAALKWRYAFARRTSGELEGRHRGAIVWTAARYPEEHDPQSPHYAFGTPIPAELVPGVK